MSGLPTSAAGPEQPDSIPGFEIPEDPEATPEKVINPMKKAQLVAQKRVEQQLKHKGQDSGVAKKLRTKMLRSQSRSRKRLRRLRLITASLKERKRPRPRTPRPRRKRRLMSKRPKRSPTAP